MNTIGLIFVLLFITLLILNIYFCQIINFLISKNKVRLNELIKEKLKKEIKSILKDKNNSEISINSKLEEKIGNFRLGINFSDIIFKELELKKFKLSECDNSFDCFDCFDCFDTDINIKGKITIKFKINKKYSGVIGSETFNAEIKSKIDLLYDKNKKKITVEVKKLDISKSEIFFGADDRENLKNIIHNITSHSKVCNTPFIEQICNIVDDVINSFIDKTYNKIREIFNDKINEIINEMKNIEKIENIIHEHIKKEIKIPHDFLMDKVIECIIPNQPSQPE
jgi:hypothetical protein